MFPACFLLPIVAAEALARDTKACQVHRVLFVPPDVQPPAGYQRRINEMVAYAEAFFERE